jgi:protein-S-isoprenylcysteine O-methyltransferase Ste14
MTQAVAVAVWVATVLLCGVIRYPHERRARKQAIVRNNFDREERLLIGLAGVGLLVLPVIHLVTGFPAFADYRFQPAVAWAGTASMALNLFVTYRSHRDLGRNFSATLQIRETHTLVVDGIYRVIQHPIYASLWLWAIGQALLIANWFVGGAGLLAIALLYVRRVRREEQMMLETFGETYAAYNKRTARLIPGIY